MDKESRTEVNPAELEKKDDQTRADARVPFSAEMRGDKTELVTGDPGPAAAADADADGAAAADSAANAHSAVDPDAAHTLEVSGQHATYPIEELVSDSGQRRTKFAPGSIVAGKYKISRLIATGGMSEVYEVHNIALDRTMALKIMHPSFGAEEECLRRFKQEAQSITALNDPRIVRSFDFGIVEGEQPYLAMELVAGKSLSVLLEESGPLEVESAVELFGQVCEGMQHAHQKGIVHRDLKPSNLIVDQNSPTGIAVHIVDFGIAKILRDETGNPSKTFTRSGEIFGSPDYMSPEQCLGMPVDQRSDIYSLGCVMYETVTGKAPFSGGSMYETIYAQVSQAPPTLSSKNPALASFGALEAVLLKAMAKKPEDRYQSMSEMRIALSNCGRASKSSWQGNIEAEWRRRRARQSERKFSLRDGILAGVLFALVVAVTVMISQSHQNSTTVTVAPVPAQGAEGQWAECNQRGQQLLDSRDYKGAIAYFEKAAKLAGSYNRDADREVWRPRYPIALEKELLASELAGDKSLYAQVSTELKAQKSKIAEESEAQDKLLLDLWHAYSASASSKDSFEQLDNKIMELAHRYVDDQQYAKAEQLLKDALRKTQQVLGADSLCAGNIYHEQGRLYLRLARYQEALPVLTKALEIRKHYLGSHDLNVGKALYNMSLINLRLGHLAESKRYLKEAVAVYSSLHDAEGLAYALSLSGSQAEKAGNLDQAVDSFKQAIDKHQQNGDYQAVRESTSMVIWLYNRLHQPERAAQFLKERLSNTAQGRNADLDNAFYNEQLADVEAQLNNLPAEEAAYAKALFLFETNEAPSDPNVRRLLQKYTWLLVRTSRGLQAQPFLQEKASIDKLFPLAPGAVKPPN